MTKDILWSLSQLHASFLHIFTVSSFLPSFLSSYLPSLLPCFFLVSPCLTHLAVLYDCTSVLPSLFTPFPFLSFNRELEKLSVSQCGSSAIESSNRERKAAAVCVEMLLARHFQGAMKAITDSCGVAKGDPTSSSSSSSRTQYQFQNHGSNLTGSGAQRSDPRPALSLEWSPSSHLKAAFEVLVSTCPSKCWEYHQTILGNQ
jgi:hypothetical protein